MTHADSFGVIRATIEADIASPGILTISSARARDGKSAVALGIARSLASSGYRTLLIDAGADADVTMAGALGVQAPPPVPVAIAAEHLANVVRPAFEGCDILSIRGGETGASAVSIMQLFTAVRAMYQYAVVDARTVADGGASFARCADGVVLAVREGRAAEPADREAVAVLDRVRARFLGVVATTGAPAGPSPADGAGVTQIVRPMKDSLASVASRMRDLFIVGRKKRETTTGSPTPE